MIRAIDKIKQSGAMKTYKKGDVVIVKKTSEECAEALIKSRTDKLFLCEIPETFSLDNSEQVFLIKKNKWDEMKNSIWSAKLRSNK